MAVPEVPVLVALRSLSIDGDFSSVTRDIIVRCIKTTGGAGKKVGCNLALIYVIVHCLKITNIFGGGEKADSNLGLT